MTALSFKERRQLFAAKWLGKHTVLFSRRDGWKPEIRASLTGFIPFFHEFADVNPNRFDLLVPLTIEAQKWLAANPGSIEPGKALVASRHSIELCDDKLAFQHFMSDQGMGGLLPKVGGKLDYPYLLKKRVGDWGVGIFIVHNRQHEQAHQVRLQSSGFFTQELIGGRLEYASHVIFARRRVTFLRTVEYAFEEEAYVRGRDCKPKSIRTVDHSHLRTLFEDILTRIDYQGICCFNYKLVGGAIRIFEINPRFGWSLTRFIDDVLPAYQAALSNHG